MKRSLPPKKVALGVSKSKKATKVRTRSSQQQKSQKWKAPPRQNLQEWRLKKFRAQIRNRATGWRRIKTRKPLIRRLQLAQVSQAIKPPIRRQQPSQVNQAIKPLTLQGKSKSSKNSRGLLKPKLHRKSSKPKQLKRNYRQTSKNLISKKPSLKKSARVSMLLSQTLENQLVYNLHQNLRRADPRWKKSLSDPKQQSIRKKKRNFSLSLIKFALKLTLLKKRRNLNSKKAGTPMLSNIIKMLHKFSKLPTKISVSSKKRLPRWRRPSLATYPSATTRNSRTSCRFSIAQKSSSARPTLMTWMCLSKPI